MLIISTENLEPEVKEYCQQWLRLLSLREYHSAINLIDEGNYYGISWGIEDIQKVANDYFDKEISVSIQKVDINDCMPELIVADDGTLIYGFYFPLNDEITDLTVEFEFKPVGSNQYKATINDIHVM